LEKPTQGEWEQFLAVTLAGDGVPQSPGTSRTATGACWGALQVLPKASPVCLMWKPVCTGEKEAAGVCTGFILTSSQSTP